MTLKDLIELQYEFDKNHGWVPDKSSMVSVLNAINKDIIGVIGELGEFSNLIKKVNLALDSGKLKEAEESFERLKPAMSEEIVDTLIYLIRIISHLEIDIEGEYKSKMDKNREKYEVYQRDEEL